MSEEENAIVEALDNLPMEDLEGYSTEYFNPEDDSKRVPSFEGRFHVIKTVNDTNALTFSFQDNLAKEVLGVVVEFHLTKTWYEKSFEQSGGGNRPDCYSNDSVTPRPDSAKKQAEKCALCKRNQFMPDPKKEGKKMKECRDTITLYIWNPKFDRPLLLRVSTMNRKRISDFIKKLGEKGVAKELITCKFTLFKDSVTSDVPFCGLKITPIATVPQMVGFFKDPANREVALNHFTEEELKVLTPKMIVERIVAFKTENAELFETEGAAAGAEAEAPSNRGKSSTPPASSGNDSPIPDHPDDSGDEPPF